MKNIMEKNDINVALITDDNYFLPAMVTIRSLCEHTKEKIIIKCIITENISEDTEVHVTDINNKYSNVDLQILYFDTTFLDDVKTKFHISKAAYVKIYLPTILETFNKVIFLDSDLLIRNDIKHLWDLFENKYELGAVWNPGYIKDNSLIGVKDTDKTFNSGVMLMNLEKMRINKSSEALEKFIKEHNGETHLNDQPAFNSIYRYNWQELPLIWNTQFQFFAKSYKKIGISKEEQKQLQSNPAIVHFTTASKPWKFRSHHPFKEEYNKYYKLIAKNPENNDFSVENLLKFIREVIILRFYKI